MTAWNATIVGVTLLRGDDDSIGTESANTKTKNYAIALTNAGQVVTTGSDTLNVNVATAITASNREGKTVTLRSAMVGKPFYDSKNAAPYTATYTLSGNSVVLTITGADWSTGTTLPANAIIDRPMTLFVTVNEV